jgi:hypothetical protein
MFVQDPERTGSRLESRELDMAEGEIGRSKNVAWNSIGPREPFGIPCY